MRWGMLVGALLWAVFLMVVTGCSYGPFRITHENGSMPKGHVALPFEGLKLRGRVSPHDQELRLVYKVEF